MRLTYTFPTKMINTYIKREKGKWVARYFNHAIKQEEKRKFTLKASAQKWIKIKADKHHKVLAELRRLLNEKSIERGEKKNGN